MIWLDYSRLTCIHGWLKRVISNWGKTRPDMGPDCKEWLDPEFLKWLWNFNRNNRQKYRDMLSGCTGKEIYIFRNRRQTRKFLKSL